MACSNKVTADILYDCADSPKKGIDGGKAVLVNTDDIDRTATTVVAGVVTNLVLKSGTTGYSLEWYKDLASSNSTFNANAEDIDGYGHSFLSRLPTSTEENAARANELKNGRFIVVYESRYKGVDSVDAFKIAGFQHGMKLSEMTYNTLENSGSILFTLATEEGDYEDYPYQILKETDYATTKASFDSLFAVV